VALRVERLTHRFGPAVAVDEASFESPRWRGVRPARPESSRWVRWPDWWLPVDRADARDALLELWRRAEAEQVEVACSGGQGRTGTALACLAVLDGVPAADVVRYVRQHYNPRAVETPWQRRYLRQFQPWSPASEATRRRSLDDRLSGHS
jgi:hypothetical protein